MSAMIGSDCGISTQGMRNGHQLWRVRWDGRPSHYAEITGPWDTTEAFCMLTDAVLERLPWTFEPGGEGLIHKVMTEREAIRSRSRQGTYKRKAGEPLP